jgi:hypothetical protein
MAKTITKAVAINRRAFDPRNLDLVSGIFLRLPEAFGAYLENLGTVTVYLAGYFPPARRSRSPRNISYPRLRAPRRRWMARSRAQIPCRPCRCHRSSQRLAEGQFPGPVLSTLRSSLQLLSHFRPPLTHDRRPPWKAPPGWCMMVLRLVCNTCPGSWPTWVGLPEQPLEGVLI